jgi:micrococcal nuclease
MTPNYCYRVKIERVLDGDTVYFEYIDLGFGVRLSKPNKLVKCRLAGIDTPESRTRNLKEKSLGKKAKERLIQLVEAAEPIPGSSKDAKQIYVESIKDSVGKFGRLLGILWINGRNVNEMLQEEDLAREYWGGKKDELGEWVIQDSTGNWLRWTHKGYILMDEA